MDFCNLCENMLYIKIDIDENGLSNMKYEIVSEEDIYNRHKLINVRF